MLYQPNSVLTQCTMGKAEVLTQLNTITITSTGTVTMTDTVNNTPANGPSVDCTLLDTAIDTQTLIVTASCTPTIAFSQGTVIMNSSPDNGLVDQSGTSDVSCTMWMVIAVLFLIIAIFAIVLSAVLGFLLHKKSSTMKTEADKKEMVRAGKLL